MRLAKDLSSLQFGVVLDTALDAVIVMRTDGSIAGWNHAAESPGPRPAQADRSALLVGEVMRALAN